MLTIYAVPSPGADAQGFSVDRLRAALEEHGCRTRGGAVQFRAVCPVHESHGSLTLAVSQGRCGAMVYCHAQCATADVLEALGLTMDDLFDEPRRKTDGPIRLRRPADPLGDLNDSERLFLRGLDIMRLRDDMAFASLVAGYPPGLPWQERVERAEDGCREDAEGHYWRTMAKYAALATDQDYVRRAYETRRKYMAGGPAAEKETPEQTAVLVIRAEDLAAASTEAAA